MALTQVSKDVLNSSQANITQVGTLANLTVSGNVAAGNVSTNNLSATNLVLSTLVGPTLFGATFEKVGTKSSATGTVVHDVANAPIWYHTSISDRFLTSWTNVPIDAYPSVFVGTLVLIQGATAYLPVPSIAQTIINGTTCLAKWQGGTEPTPTANGIDVVSFSMIDAGGTYKVLLSLTSYS